MNSTWRYGASLAVRNLIAIVFLMSVPAAAFAQKTIIAFGDSLTQGFGLQSDQGFVPQLEAWLNANGSNVRVVNAGVSGDTTAGGKARIDWTLAELADAIIVALGANDVLRGLAPAQARENLRYVIEAAQAKGLAVLFVGTDVPANYGPDYQSDFLSIYPDLAAEYGTHLYPRFFAGLFDANSQGEALMQFVQPDGLHPNAAGVAKIVEAMGPSVQQLLD